MALALGADSFCLSLGLGSQGIDKTKMWIFTGLVGLLHTIFPLMGFFIGHTALHYLGTLTRLLGAGILIIMGIKIILASGRQTACGQKYLLNGYDIGILALGVSIDSLLIGFSLGTFEYNSLEMALIFGFMAAFLTRLAFFLGSRVKNLIGSCGYVTGLILIALGVKAFF